MKNVPKISTGKPQVKWILGMT